MSTAHTAAAPRKRRPLPEDAFNKMVDLLDGPANRGLERLMKSRVFLAPMAASMTLSCRLFIAARDGRIGALLGTKLNTKLKTEQATGGAS